MNNNNIDENDIDENDIDDNNNDYSFIWTCGNCGTDHWSSGIEWKVKNCKFPSYRYFDCDCDPEFRDSLIWDFGTSYEQFLEDNSGITHLAYLSITE